LDCFLCEFSALCLTQTITYTVAILGQDDDDNDDNNNKDNETDSDSLKKSILITLGSLGACQLLIATLKTYADFSARKFSGVIQSSFAAVTVLARDLGNARQMLKDSVSLPLETLEAVNVIDSKVSIERNLLYLTASFYRLK
jgi:hypothetical protein